MLSSSIWAYRLLFVLFISFHILFLYATENPMLVDHWNKSSPKELTPIYPKKKLPLLDEKSPTPQHLSKLVNKNKILNLNIDSYFLNILASPDVLTWSTTGGTINKTIKHIGLTRHHRKTVYRTWHMVNKWNKREEVEIRHVTSCYDKYNNWWELSGVWLHREENCHNQCLQGRNEELIGNNKEAYAVFFTMGRKN